MSNNDYDENNYTYNGHKPRAFQSREDLIAHMGDPRYAGKLYEKDEAYIRWVEACACLTDDTTVGVNVDLSGAMVKKRDFQDLNDDLGKMTDTYHTSEEMQKDMRDPRYKTDAYFREVVAQKIARSTPDEVVPISFEKHHAIQFGGGGDEGEEGGE